MLIEDWCGFWCSTRVYYKSWAPPPPPPPTNCRGREYKFGPEQQRQQYINKHFIIECQFVRCRAVTEGKGCVRGVCVRVCAVPHTHYVHLNMKRGGWENVSKGPRGGGGRAGDGCWPIALVNPATLWPSHIWKKRTHPLSLSLSASINFVLLCGVRSLAFNCAGSRDFFSAGGLFVFYLHGAAFFGRNFLLSV